MAAAMARFNATIGLSNHALKQIVKRQDLRPLRVLGSGGLVVNGGNASVTVPSLRQEVSEVRIASRCCRGNSRGRLRELLFPLFPLRKPFPRGLPPPLSARSARPASMSPER